MSTPNMDMTAVLPPVVTISEKTNYPGGEATAGQLINLADEYFGAAYALLSQVEPILASSSAPARLCAIHAIEMYLNGFLIFHDVSHKQVRGLQHDLAERTALAVEKGLCLRTKTRDHLRRMTDQREYLIVRYDPEQIGSLPELNRLFATTKEVCAKVTNSIRKQPYDQSDPRFKKYW